jgi:hypothetical protein
MHFFEMVCEDGLDNVTAVWSAVLPCIWEVLGSNVSTKTGYPEAVHGFSHSLQAYARIIP